MNKLMVNAKEIIIYDVRIDIIKQKDNNDCKGQITFSANKCLNDYEKEKISQYLEEIIRN